MFPCARTGASAIKSKRSRQLTIDFAKYVVKRPEYRRNIRPRLLEGQPNSVTEEVPAISPTLVLGCESGLSRGAAETNGESCHLWIISRTFR
jgi:hypothetical protein